MPKLDLIPQQLTSKTIPDIADAIGFLDNAMNTSVTVPSDFEYGGYISDLMASLKKDRSDLEEEYNWLVSSVKGLVAVDNEYNGIASSLINNAVKKRKPRTIKNRGII